MKFKNWINILQTKNEETNYCVSSEEVSEMRKHLSGKRGLIYKHDKDNRKQRRDKKLTGIINNRSNPSKRRKVAYKMAWFHMCLQNMLLNK